METRPYSSCDPGTSSKIKVKFSEVSKKNVIVDVVYRVVFTKQTLFLVRKSSKYLVLALIQASRVTHQKLTRSLFGYFVFIKPRLTCYKTDCYRNSNGNFSFSLYMQYMVAKA